MGLCDICTQLLSDCKTFFKRKKAQFVQNVNDVPKSISEYRCLKKARLYREKMSEFLRQRDARTALKRLPHLDPAQSHVSSAFLETCAALLQSEDLQVQREISLSLVDLLTCGMIHEDQIIEVGFLEHLVDLLQSGDMTVQCNTSACIALLASSDFNREAIVSTDCVLPLLILARDFDPKVQKNAVRAICNLTKSESTLGVLCEEGAIPVLALLLQSADSDIQFYSCSALSNIATAPEQHTRMLQLGDRFLLKSLVSLMGSSVLKNSSQACQCIKSLTKNGRAQQQLLGLKWTPPLLVLLRAPELSASQPALLLLSQLAAHPCSRRSLADGNMLYMLGELLLTHPSSPTVVTHCAITLSHLWGMTEDQQVVLERQCLPGLLLALEFEWNEDETLLSLLSCLQSLVCYDSLRTHLKEKLTAMHVAKLVKFTSEMENLELSFAAGSVISKLDMNDQMLKPHRETIVAYLVRFLRNQEVRFQQLAIISVCNLSKGGDLRGMACGWELEHELKRVQQQTEHTRLLLQMLQQDGPAAHDNDLPPAPRPSPVLPF